MFHGEHVPPGNPQAEFYRKQRQILARRMDEAPITPRVDAAVPKPSTGSTILPFSAQTATG